MKTSSRFNDIVLLPFFLLSGISALTSCTKDVEEGQRGIAAVSIPDNKENHLPRSFTALANIGSLVNEKKVSEIKLDEQLWNALSDGKSAPVPLLKGNQRNMVYVGLYHIVNLHNIRSTEASLERTTTALSAVLGFGLFSDYLAVSGAITRIQSKFGSGYFHDDNWKLVFSKLDDIEYFIDNEMSSVEASTHTVNVDQSAQRELREIYKGLFRRSNNIEEFKENTLKMNKSMELKLKSDASAVAMLYFDGPALEKLAIPVYRNRGLKSEPTSQP